MTSTLKRTKFFGIYIDLLTMDETIDRISEYIEKRECIQHVVVNVAKLVYAQKDENLRNIINSCPIVNVDGAGIVLGAKFLGMQMPKRVTGIDLMQRLIAYSAQRSYRVYFFGAEEDVVKKVVEIYQEKYPELIIAGYRNGYYSPEEEAVIAENIAKSEPDIIFVAMGSPKKEIFLNKYRDKMHIPFVMGVGGSFDVIAGKVSRAPYWVQENNLEWLYRLCQEPKRMWKRYLYTNSVFLMMLIKEFLKQKFPFFNRHKLEGRLND